MPKRTQRKPKSVPMPEQMTSQEIANKLRLLLEGDDGSCRDNDERARDATKQWYKTNMYSADELLDMMKGGTVGVLTSERLWRNRHGRPYQSELESHVANYREPAPIRPWPEIVEACRVRGIYICVMPGRIGYHVIIYDLCDESVFSRAEVAASDLQDAVGLAAITAIEALEGTTSQPK